MDSHELAHKLLALPNKEVCVIERNQPYQTVVDAYTHMTPHDGVVIRLSLDVMD